jgi:hypothetical protein
VEAARGTYSACESEARNSRRCRCTCGLQKHARLTVAALVRPLQGRRIVRGFRRTACGSPTHGGLTFAAPGARAKILRTVPRRRCKCVSRTHGGLTPAAPIAYATRHRKSRISQAMHVEQPRAAGVSQPWFPKRNCTLIHGTLRRPLHLPTHGGLTLARSHPATFATSRKCVFRTHTWLLSRSGV